MSEFGLEDHEELHATLICKKYEEQEKIQGFRHLTWQQRKEAVEHLRSAKIDSIKNGDAARLKATKKFFRQTQPYVHLTSGERRNLLVRIADSIAIGPELELICHAVDKRFYYAQKADGLVERAFIAVVRRFETFLAVRAKEDKQATSGLIVHDHNQDVAARLTKLMSSLHKYTERDRRIRRIVDTPLFVDSKLTRMVQIADLCAFAVRRYFDTKDHDLYDRISKKFHYRNGKLAGIRHYSRESCRCRICRQTDNTKVQARLFDELDDETG